MISLKIPNKHVARQRQFPFRTFRVNKEQGAVSVRPTISYSIAGSEILSRSLHTNDPARLWFP